jgi:hypothetical protein
MPPAMVAGKVEIGNDYILVVKRDSLDVAEVVMHRMRKGG